GVAGGRAGPPPPPVPTPPLPPRGPPRGAPRGGGGARGAVAGPPPRRRPPRLPGGEQPGGLGLGPAGDLGPGRSRLPAARALARPSTHPHHPAAQTRQGRPRGHRQRHRAHLVRAHGLGRRLRSSLPSQTHSSTEGRWSSSLNPTTLVASEGRSDAVP